MKKHVINRLLSLLAISILAAPLLSHLAMAEGTNEAPGAESEKAALKPATKYSGRTPIDLKNGILFNNGTYGVRNKNYEAWAQKPVLVPGMSELPYPYSEREDFIAACEDNELFVSSAIHNWKLTSANTKPEAKEYGEKSVQTMQPLLDRFSSAVKACKSSSQNDWDKNQADARRALIEMRGTYASLHRNVH